MVTLFGGNFRFSCNDWNFPRSQLGHFRRNFQCRWRCPGIRFQCRRHFGFTGRRCPNERLRDWRVGQLRPRTLLLDPNRMEESSACPVLIAALLPRSQSICFLNSELRLASDKLPVMVDLLKRGVGKVFWTVGPRSCPSLSVRFDRKEAKF